MKRRRPMLETIIQKSEYSNVIKIEDFPSLMRITDYSLDKVLEIEKIVAEEFGNYEWYGYLIAEEGDPNFTIVDVLLPESYNLSTYTEPNLSDKVVLDKMLQDRGQYIIGWVHSHNTLGIGFSHTDFRNMEGLVESARDSKKPKLNLEIVKKKYRRIVVCDKSEVRDMANTEPSLIITFDGYKLNEEIKNLDVNIYEPIFGTFFFSLLISREDPYWYRRWYRKWWFKGKKEKNDKHDREKTKYKLTQHITTLKYSILRGNIEIKHRHIPLEIIPIDRTFDKEKFRDEVLRKVKISPIHYHYPSYHHYDQEEENDRIPKERLLKTRLRTKPKRKPRKKWKKD